MMCVITLLVQFFLLNYSEFMIKRYLRNKTEIRVNGNLCETKLYIEHKQKFGTTTLVKRGM